MRSATEREGSVIDPTSDDIWANVPGRFREHGLRWTPQRRLLASVLQETEGHVTGAELVDRCRVVDHETVPSTVYRTLDVFEELGLIRHIHGVDGREEYHVLPTTEHGHLRCTSCGATSELHGPDLAALNDDIRRVSGFRVDLSHVSLAGLCDDCARAADRER